MIGPDHISAAEGRIAPHIRRTPLLLVERGGLGLDFPITLKLEFLQHTGSFKPRGAFARLLAEPPPAAGVIAASGGNHGAAVAYAARRLGLAAEIFVPAAAPTAKVARIASYGARVVCVGSNYSEALTASEARRAETGALAVHAYDDPDVLAGQGTIGCELARDVPELSHLLVATGGGGLIGGIAAWFQGRVSVVSVEPEACPTLHAALGHGRPVPVEVGGLAADSLGARQAGSAMFPIAQAHVADAVLVTDAAIRAAQRLIWDSLRVTVEPGGATALAALCSGAYRPPPGARVGVVLCGANTDPASLAGP